MQTTRAGRVGRARASISSNPTSTPPASQASLIQPAEPRIPAEADLVFVCDVLHHVPDRAAWLDKVVAEMKVGARLVLIEFKEGDLPEGPPESAKITRAQILELATKAGLTLASERADLLPHQTFLVFRKPS